MRSLPIYLWGLACMLPVSPGRAQTADQPAEFARLSDVIGQMHGAAAPAGPALTLDEVERIALENNPEIHVAVRRVTAAEAAVPLAGALDDPQFMYRGWQVPLNQPQNYNAAQNMFMIGRSLPGPGKRTLRTDVAKSGVDSAKDELAAVRLRVQVETRKAFYDLLLAQDELRIHDEHVGIAGQALQAARIKYTVGKVPQVEILKAQVALTRLAEHMIRFERDAEVARARLNTLLGREPGAALQVEGDYGLGRPLPALGTLEQAALHDRPDLMEAEAAIEKSRREQALAKKAFAPDFNVAAGYMLMPAGSNERNNYMVEGSITLPWLNRRKHEGEVSQAAAASNEKESELDAMRNAARGEIQEALAEAQAAQHLARVYQDSLRPQAEETLHSAVIAYENDQVSFMDLLDSQMAVIDAGLAWVDALGDFNARVADLEMATGTTMEDVSGAQKGEHQ